MNKQAKEDGKCFLCMNKNGMIVDKAKNFNGQASGYLMDVIQNTRNIFPNNNSINSIEIIFENKTVLIQDNITADINYSLIIDNEKK